MLFPNQDTEFRGSNFSIHFSCVFLVFFFRKRSVEVFFGHWFWFWDGLDLKNTACTSYQKVWNRFRLKIETAVTWKLTAVMEKQEPISQADVPVKLFSAKARMGPKRSKDSSEKNRFTISSRGMEKSGSSIFELGFSNVRAVSDLASYFLYLTTTVGALDNS